MSNASVWLSSLVPRSTGLIATSLNEGDSLIGVGITSGKDDIILATSSGMAIRFSEDSIRAMGRQARGVRGIRLDEQDVVVGMSVISAAADQGVISTEEAPRDTLLTVCQYGYGKRSKIEDYRMQNRGGKGVIDIKNNGT